MTDAIAGLAILKIATTITKHPRPCLGLAIYIVMMAVLAFRTGSMTGGTPEYFRTGVAASLLHCSEGFTIVATICRLARSVDRTWRGHTFVDVPACRSAGALYEALADARRIGVHCAA